MRRDASLPCAHLLVAVGLLSTAWASEEPVPQPPQIEDLSVVSDEASGPVVVRWSGGTPPFAVVRGDNRSFADSSTIEYVGMQVQEREFTDKAVPRDGRPYYYQVYDRNSKPEIFRIEPTPSGVGDLITVRGIGFSPDCAQNRFMFEGSSHSELLSNCSFTEFQLTIPPDVVSGVVVVIGPGGIGGFGDNQSEHHDAIRYPKTWAQEPPGSR